MIAPPSGSMFVLFCISLLPDLFLSCFGGFFYFFLPYGFFLVWGGKGSFRGEESRQRGQRSELNRRCFSLPDGRLDRKTSSSLTELN